MRRVISMTCINKPSKKKTTSGQSALSKMIRNSTDQVVGFAKQRYTGKSASSNIARDISMLTRMLNVERKQVDTLMTATAVSGSASLVTYITSAAQGTSGSQRDGDSVKIVRIDANLLFQFGSGTANSVCNQVFNYYLVRNLKTPSTSGTTPFAIADFLNVDGSGLITPLSLPNNDLAENFQVMVSGTIVVASDYATATNNTRSLVVPISHECGFHQTFTGSASTTIVDNALFWVFTAVAGPNTGGNSTVAACTRLWYVDN